MKLQELIGQNNLDMTIDHIKAFYLGAMTAERPLPFAKATEEMLSETPEVIKLIEGELKKLWDDLQKNKPYDLQKIFPESSDLRVFLSSAKDQLDFYLTALSLAGTNVESCKNEDVADLIDELEDTVMDLEEYLSDDNADKDEGVELKEMLLEAWHDYLKTSKL
jgi:hypothetical protein